MRTLLVYRHEFNFYVYPAVVSAPSANESELECSLRLIRKLKDPAISEAKPISPEQQEAIDARGGRGYPLQKLKDQQANLLLAEDELQLLLARLRASISLIESAFAEEFLALLKRVKDAPTIPDPVAAPT